MIHARDDYNRIQDPDGLIPDNEPVFLLRGQDIHASEVLRYYAYLVDISHGDHGVVERTRRQADLMDAWPKKKQPDITNRSTLN